jgi:hypothetical protein
MIKISLTDFIDVVTRSGSPKQTKVKELKTRGDYHPMKDYWGPLRDHIADYHKIGAEDKRYLDEIIPTFKDASKQANCRALIVNYKRFLGRKVIQTLVPPRAYWRYKTLTVRINPELYLSLDGKRHVIKLYFKGAPLSRSKVELVHLLMMKTLAHKLEADAPVYYTLLDVHHNRPYSTLELNNRLEPLLYGEADALITMWDRLD